MTLNEGLKCFVLGSLSLLLFAGFVLILRVPNIIHSEAEATRAMLSAQTHIAIEDANDRMADALSGFDAALGATESDVHAAAVNADRRTGEALSIVREAAADTSVTLANAEIDLNHLTVNTSAQMGTLNGTVAEALKPVTEVAQQVNSALPLFTDCQYGYDPDGSVNYVGNRSCLPIRYDDLSSSLDRTLSAVAQAAPSMVASADKIAASSVDTSAAVAATGKEVAIAAHRFNAPLTRWQRFGMWLGIAAKAASGVI